MGWTSFAHHGRGTIDILKDEFKWGSDRPYTCTILDHSQVGATVYMVIEHRPKPGTEWKPDHLYLNDPDGTYRFIAVIKTERRAGEFAYKDMCESMGPVEQTCPKRLIDLASPLRAPEPGETGTGRVWAADWRRKCLENIARKREAGKRKLADGTKIRLSREVNFKTVKTDGPFTVATIERRGRKNRCFWHDRIGYCRLGNIDEIGYEVLA
jgi:hypothetical protein